MRIRNVFKNGSSANMKLSKNQLFKIGQSGGFSSILLGSLPKNVLAFMKNVLKPLAKRVLSPLRLIAAAAAATDAAIQKKVF